MREKYLPLGSVVNLKKAGKPVMITGYIVTRSDSNNSEKYDYLGCIYPVGIIDTSINVLFNHVDIDNILYVGYEDEECKNYLSLLKEEDSEKNVIEDEIL